MCACAGAEQWGAVASSADGSLLIATCGGLPLYVSHDSGYNWLPHGAARSWYPVASSDSGVKLIAAVSQGLDEPNTAILTVYSS